MRMLIGLVLALLVGPAVAHDDAQWIQEGAFTSPVDGSRCCGPRDCHSIPEDAVTRLKGGYLLSGGEYIPEVEAQPSRDGMFWRCSFPDNRRRCFFAPPEGS